MYEQQISRGAEWLDKQMPGWELMIDPNELRLDNACTCVLGQLFDEQRLTAGGYWDCGYEYATQVVAGDIYWEGEHWAGDHGFSFSVPADPEMWEDLTKEWIAFVKDRLDKGVQLPL